MTNTVEVRVSTLDDFDQVSSLLRASYPELMRPAYDAELLEKVLPRMTEAQPGLLQSGTYYVADVRHSFTAEGYRQTFKLIRNAIGETGLPSSSDVLQGIRT